NFIVRPKRRFVEKYQQPDAWGPMSAERKAELLELAGLPAATPEEPEEAKRFDLLVLNLQLALVRGDGRFKRWRDQIKAIASALEELSSIPAVRDHLPLIEDLQRDAWWEDVTLAMLEIVRRRLRSLVPLIEKKRRKIVYTDFEDELGEIAEVEI